MTVHTGQTYARQHKGELVVRTYPGSTLMAIHQARAVGVEPTPIGLGLIALADTTSDKHEDGNEAKFVRGY